MGRAKERPPQFTPQLWIAYGPFCTISCCGGPGVTPPSFDHARGDRCLDDGAHSEGPDATSVRWLTAHSKSWFAAGSRTVRPKSAPSAPSLAGLPTSKRGWLALSPLAPLGVVGFIFFRRQLPTRNAYVARITPTCHFDDRLVGRTTRRPDYRWRCRAAHFAPGLHSLAKRCASAILAGVILAASISRSLAA
jgi:hypothetical protein